MIATLTGISHNNFTVQEFGIFEVRVHWGNGPGYHHGKNSSVLVSLSHDALPCAYFFNFVLTFHVDLQVSEMDYLSIVEV